MIWPSLTFGILIFTLIPIESQSASRKLSDSTSEINILKQISGKNSVSSDIGAFNKAKKSNNIAILHDSNGIEKEYQADLIKSVFVALRDLDENDLNPQFIDLSKVDVPLSSGDKESTQTVPSTMDIVTQWIMRNHTTTIVSLLHEDSLKQFAESYDQLVRSSRSDFAPELKIFTPRLIDIKKESTLYPVSSVKIYSFQMSPKALSTALLNRVKKEGIQTLIPLLDGDSSSEMMLFNEILATGEQLSIQFTKPIFINNPNHLASFKEILNEYGNGFSKEKLRQHSGNSRDLNSNMTIGVIMLASKGSQVAMKVAAEKKHMQLSWFSPNILQHEEWAYQTENDKPEVSSNEVVSEEGGSNATKLDSGESQEGDSSEIYADVNPNFGLYSVSFVGSYGWDNPLRRRALRELTSYTGANPRILTAVLAYDSAVAAINNVRKELSFPMTGLSGQIMFDENGYRNDGVFFGVSAVPDLSSPSVTLLQPSTWILEDTTSITETIEGQFLIREYVVATSSVLTGEDLRSLANQTKADAGCVEHIMNVITHDPFNQMPYNYFFKESNLPDNILIPNQHGFGINLLCIHENSNESQNQTDSPTDRENSEEGIKQQDINGTLTTTLRIACTPGIKISEPMNCFRSHTKRRKRSPVDKVPEVQYQYGFGDSPNWYQPQNTKWSIPNENSGSGHYYQSLNKYYYGPSTPSYLRRADTAASSGAETTTAAPATSKLPELRQILKAAKPFVGSCIGSTTGCAMCVLVLGRLPLGAVPAACTGPCFVGTFGSCGSLLGRVFSETTVICTEMFRQGLIDSETFVADAEFGRMMYLQSPTTLQGYQLMAIPLVEAMQKSAIITKIVSTFALPWAHHMRFLMGRAPEPNIPGLVIHTLGFPMCNIAGQFYSFYSSNFPSLPPNTIYLTILLILILTLLSKLNSLNNRKRSAIKTSRRTFSYLNLVLVRSQELIRHLFT